MSRPDLSIRITVRIIAISLLSSSSYLLYTGYQVDFSCLEQLLVGTECAQELATRHLLPERDQAAPAAASFQLPDPPLAYLSGDRPESLAPICPGRLPALVGGTAVYLAVPSLICPDCPGGGPPGFLLVKSPTQLLSSPPPFSIPHQVCYLLIWEPAFTTTCTGCDCSRWYLVLS